MKTVKVVAAIITKDGKIFEHEAAKWLSPDQLDDLDWLPADVKVVEAIKGRG